MTAWAAASCVVLAAGTVAWPVPGARARGRRVLGTDRSTHRPAPRLAGRLRSGWPPGLSPYPPVLVGGVVLLAALLGGPVAGVVAGAYGTVALRAATARVRARARAQHRAELLDAIGSAAADLRAGLPAATAVPAVIGEGRAVTGEGRAVTGEGRAVPDPLHDRVRAAVRLAERTGAPLAVVLERIEADARGADRARAASAAQAAGATATAWLLAALPAGGIGLGYAIGADPLAVLLHTPVGAGCAFGALGLQLAGLVWARRITRPAGPDGEAA